VLHLLEAAVLTPKIVGHRVGLSESAALLAVVAGGKLLGFVGVVLAVPIAATFAVLVRYAVRYYESTAFFGRESDADVVITPAMALIMPAQPWIWTGGVWESDRPLRDLAAAIRLETSIAAAAHPEPAGIEPELGPPGPVRPSEPALAPPSEPPAAPPVTTAERTPVPTVDEPAPPPPFDPDKPERE